MIRRTYGGSESFALATMLVILTRSVPAMAACGRALLAGTALAPLALAGSALLQISVALGQGCSFTNALDSGAGSLRKCVDDAASGDTILSGIVPPSGVTVTLATSITFNKSLTLGGSNAFTVFTPTSQAFTLSGSDNNNFTVGNMVKIASAASNSSSILILSGRNTVNLEGAVETAGVASYGIYAFGGANKVKVSGSIKTAGVYAYGITAIQGDNIVTVSGSVETAGPNAHGIIGVGGNNIFTVSGSIETAGINAYGISAVHGNTTATISGSIKTAENNALGIYTSDGNNVVIVSGTVSAANADAITFGMGGNNRLELQPNYSIAGDVRAYAGGGDTLAFGGYGLESFDLNRIGNGGAARTQFHDFQYFAVESGIWTFSGTTSQAFDVAGGTLAGTGTLGGLTINGGGTHAPGNSIGAQTVNGAYSNAGTLEIEIAENGVSDQIVVNGTVDVTGGRLRLRALPGAGNWRLAETYRIIDNDDSEAISGSFTLENTLAFFDADLDHAGGTGNDVVLTMTRNDIGMVDLAQTTNQQGVASALGSFGTSSPVYGQIVGMTAADARAAYDSASGEIHASGQHLIDKTFALFQSTLGSSGAGIAAEGVGQTVPLAYGPTPGTAVAGLLAVEAATGLPPTHHSVWLSPLGGSGTAKADGNAAQLNWWSGGIAAGYETSTTLAGSDASFGLGLGYLAGGGSIPDRLSALTTQGGYLGVYGDWSDGLLSLRGNMAYGASHVRTERDIVIGALTSTAQAEYWNHTAGASFEASYGFALTERFTVAPLGRLDAAWWGHAAAQETGAGALNNTLDPASLWRLDTGLGVEMAQVFALDAGGTVTLTARALWERGFGDTTPNQTMTLAGGGGPFTVAGPDAGRDRLLLGAGLSYQPSDTLTLSANYGGVFGGNQHSHTGKIGLQVKF